MRAASPSRYPDSGPFVPAGQQHDDRDLQSAAVVRYRQGPAGKTLQVLLNLVVSGAATRVVNKLNGVKQVHVTGYQHVRSRRYGTCIDDAIRSTHVHMTNNDRR